MWGGSELARCVYSKKDGLELDSKIKVKNERALWSLLSAPGATKAIVPDNFAKNSKKTEK